MLDNTTRDALIVDRYKHGETQEELADAFHLTRGRIQQILKLAGVSYRDSPRTPRGDRYSFVGTNIAKPLKARLLQECARTGKSMSRVVEELLEQKFTELDEPAHKDA